MAKVGALPLDDKHAWIALSPGSKPESFPRTWSIKARFLELAHQAVGYCSVHLLSTFLTSLRVTALSPLGPPDSRRVARLF